MFALLRPLLVIYWYLQLPAGDASRNEFHYQDISTGNGNGESTCVPVYVYVEYLPYYFCSTLIVLLVQSFFLFFTFNTDSYYEKFILFILNKTNQP